MTYVSDEEHAAAAAAPGGEPLTWWQQLGVLACYALVLLALAVLAGAIPW